MTLFSVCASSRLEPSPPPRFIKSRSEKSSSENPDRIWVPDTVCGKPEARDAACLSRLYITTLAIFSLFGGFSFLFPFLALRWVLLCLYAKCSLGGRRHVRAAHMHVACCRFPLVGGEVQEDGV